MKRFFLLTLVMSAVLSSCKKENQENYSQSIVGRWEIRRIFGSQIANAPTTFGKGNGQILEFTDTEYRYIEGGNIKYTEGYRLASESKEIDGNTYDRVVIATKYNFKQYFKIVGKNLTISTGSQAVDGATVVYERL